MKQRNFPELTFFFFVILVLADKAMLKCVPKCSTTTGRTFENQGQWHCAYCFQICERKNAMTVHLNTHSKVNVSVPLITKERPKNKTGHSRAAPQAEKSSSSSAEAKIECPQCSKAYPHNKALQRHIRDQHTRKMEATISPGRHLKGACVDFEKGLFMISRTFSGVVYISHSLPAPRQCTIRSQTSIHLMRAGWMRGRCSSNQTEWSSCFLNAYSYKVYSAQALLKNP